MFSLAKLTKFEEHVTKYLELALQPLFTPYILYFRSPSCALRLLCSIALPSLPHQKCPPAKLAHHSSFCEVATGSSFVAYSSDYPWFSTTPSFRSTWLLFVALPYSTYPDGLMTPLLLSQALSRRPASCLLTRINDLDSSSLDHVVMLYFPLFVYSWLCSVPFFG